MRRGAAILLAIALSVAGCRTQTVIRGGVEVPVAIAVAADLEAARVDLDELRPRKARDRLENLVQEIPGGPRNLEVFFLLAETYKELGQLEPAIASYRAVVGRRSRSSFVPLAHLRLGELYRATGRPELARRALARAPFDRAEREIRVRLYLLLAELTEEAGQIREAVRWLAYARRDVVERAEVEEL
ncbi:MAG: tetratricopeptide repeat protein, partial [Myxococcota bacterium]